MELRLEEGEAGFSHEQTPAPKDDNDNDNQSLRCCKKNKWNTIPIALMVIFLGLAATAAFLGLGISSARSASQEAFEQSAAVLIQQVEIAWKDYEVAALWTHQACTSHEDFAHQEFRELYEHLASTGIDAQIEWVPKVAHAQRQEMERQSREYYAKEYPGVVDYKGFVGIEPIVVDNVTSGETGLLPRSDADFYYPIHFIEPLGLSGSAIDLDVYTRGSAKLSIDKAMETWKPTLSEPFKLVEETVDHASAVFLMHPGTPLSTQPDLRPKDLALLVIRIPDLVRRATMTQATPTSVFLYDTTDSGEEEQNELFLGGVVLNGGDDDSSCKLLPPTSLRKIRSDSRLIRERVAPIADREWTIAVVAFPDTYETQTAFVIIGATLLFICSLCTAAWIFSNIRYSIMKREAKLKEIQAAAESEKAALVLENATRAAQAERTLNDFIAHEVRNPVSAAISACSFVRTAVREPVPLADEESRQSVRDDVDIINDALAFVNDLLRNMLDMHRASDKQLKIETKLTDIYNDVLKPVDSLLYRRGNSEVEFILDCQPPNLIVDTDRLRLKQIMLNFCRNSQKFVERGFIRLSARIVNGKVQMSVEDSGPGIPVEKRKRLFHKFQESLDCLEQGTGIGLHLCDKLIRLMNGSVCLDETYDSGVENCPGTRFVIDLNMPPSSLDDLMSDALTSSAIPTRETALLVDRLESIDTAGAHSLSRRELPTNLSVLFTDDDMIVRKLFCRAVKKVAPTWNVHEASNGETAVRLATEEGQDFDLVFMDQFMASFERQMLGTDTVRELRARGVNCIICGLSANDKEVQFLEAGADAFLIKPFPCKKDELELALKKILFSRDDSRQRLPEMIVT